MASTAAELVIKISAQGTAELDKVAAATKSVGEGTRLAGMQLRTFDATLQSLVASGKSFKGALEEMAASQGVLSQSIRGTAQDLLLQMKAADGDAEAIRKLNGQLRDAHQISEQAAASGTIRVAEGNQAIRAAESFLVKILGLGPALQAIFPIVGAIALGEMVAKAAGEVKHLAEEWDPVLAAEKRAKDALEDYGNTVAKVKAELRALDEAAFRRAAGPVAGAANEATGLAGDEQTFRLQAKNLQVEVDKLRGDIVSAQAEADAAPRNSRTGKKEDREPLLRIREDKASIQALTTEISRLTNEADKIGKKVTAKSGDSLDAQQDITDKKKADADARAKSIRDGEFAARQELQSLQARELDGVARINELLRIKLELLKQQGVLSPKREEEEREIAVEQIRLGLAKALATARKEAYAGATRDANTEGRDEQRGDKFAERQYFAGLKKKIADGTKDVTADLQIIKRGDEIDTDQVKRQLQAQLYGIHRSVQSGSMSGQDAAGTEYQAALKAAQEIFRIDTQHLDLITDQDKRDEAYWAARKKRADQEYQAEAKYQEELDNLRAKDLEKYRSEAGKLFDALTNRQRGAGFEITQMLRGMGVSTARTIFQNVATKPLQAIGQTIARAVPESLGLGGILRGTIFDSANKGVEGKIEANTKDTVGWLKSIYNRLSGQNAADPSAANPNTAPGLSAGSTPLSETLGIPAGMTFPAGGDLAKVLGGSSSAGGYVAALGKVLGIGGFGAGASSVLNGNALSILLGQNSTGPTTLSAQIGAGVGLAGAVGAGAYGIASGIGQGGVGGDLKAAGSAAGLVGGLVGNVSKLLGAASPLLSAIPIVGSIAAIALPLLGGLFSQGPEQRAKQIQKELTQGQYIAPIAINETRDTKGNYVSYDKFGRLEQTGFSATPQISEPYLEYKRVNGNPGYYNAPGGVISPYGGPSGPASPAPAPVIQHIYQAGAIQTMDASSFHDFVTKNHEAIGAAAAKNLNTGDGPLATTIDWAKSGRG